VQLPAAIPIETRNAAVKAVRDGATVREAASRFGIGTATLERWLARVRRGEDLGPRGRRAARRRLLGPDDLAVIEDIVTANPYMNRDEVVEAFMIGTGKRVSAPTLARAMAAAGIWRQRPVLTSTRPHSDGPERRKTRYEPHHRAEREGGLYPSSLTDAEWMLLRPIFEEATDSRGRPAVHDRRTMLDAIFYVVRTGCSWRMLPADFPAWQAVYATFRRWSYQGRFERMGDQLRQMWRQREGRHPEPSAGIVDSQSAKTTEKGGPAASTGTRRSMEGSGTSS